MADRFRRLGVLGIAQIADTDDVLYEILRELERQSNQALTDINNRLLQVENAPGVVIPEFPKIDVFEKMATGYATLIAGTVVVYEPKTDSSRSHILVTLRNVGGTPGHYAAPTANRITAQRFTINSYDAAGAFNAADTSEVEWFLVNE